MESPKQYLLDMATVHAFYSKLLRDKLGFEIPVPQDVTAAIAEQEKVEQSVQLLARWLSMLDLAIAPMMGRDGLKEITTKEAAEGLLRYYFRKHSPEDADRDKADFVVTYLFRFLSMPLR